jgi:hypothetical protein
MIHIKNMVFSINHYIIQIKNKFYKINKINNGKLYFVLFIIICLLLVFWFIGLDLSYIISKFSVVHASTNSDLLFEIRSLRAEVQGLQSDIMLLNNKLKKICMVLDLAFQGLNLTAENMSTLNQTLLHFNNNVLSLQTLIKEVNKTLDIYNYPIGDDPINTLL